MGKKALLTVGVAEIVHQRQPEHKNLFQVKGKSGEICP